MMIWLFIRQWSGGCDRCMVCYSAAEELNATAEVRRRVGWRVRTWIGVKAACWGCNYRIMIWAGYLSCYGFNLSRRMCQSYFGG